VPIGSEKHVALTTYRKDGSSSSTPVSITDLEDGKVGLITPSRRLRVKRLANDNRERVQPSDGKGDVRKGTSPVEGTAVMVDGVEFETVRRRIRSKFGFFMSLLWTVGTLVARVIGKGAHRPDRVIVIALSPNEV
jgi:PPOX class probable F420-dependent enzyme